MFSSSLHRICIHVVVVMKTRIMISITAKSIWCSVLVQSGFHVFNVGTSVNFELSISDN